MAIADFLIPEIENESWQDLPISNGHFGDDIWDLRPLMNNKRAGVHANGILNFKLLENKPLIVEPIKRYLYIRLGHVKPITVSHEYNNFGSKFIAYLDEHQLSSIEDIDTARFIDFNTWLKKHYWTNKSSSDNNLASIANTLLQIITIGQSSDFPNLPQDPIVLEISVWDWWKVNENNRQLRKSGPSDKSIPAPIWQQIIQKAWEEPDILQNIAGGESAGLFRLNHAKFGVLIQAYTGLRISEVVYLKTNCVEADNQGRYWLNAEIEKTEREPMPHRILISKEIYELIRRLDQLSQPLRDEADDNRYMFYLLSKRAKKEDGQNEAQRLTPAPLESGKWNSQVLEPFLKRNNLPLTFQNTNNQTIKINSHCFRHTFARIAVAEKNVNPAVIQTHFKHLSIEMTMHYINLTKSDLKQSYLKGMIETDSIYTQGKEGEEFKQKINEAKTQNDLNEIVDNLSKIFGINPLPFGLCLYDFKRGHCPNLGVQSCYMIGCGDFVSNETFLPNFEHEIYLLEKHIEKCKCNGQEIEVKKSMYQMNKLQNIVDAIKIKE